MQIKSAAELSNSISTENSNRAVYSNRKRKRDVTPWQPPCNKINNDGPSYTLNEEDYSDEKIEVNFWFSEFQKIDSEDYEDSEPTFIVPDADQSTEGNENSEHAHSAEDNENIEASQSTDDSDCFITNEPSVTVIDLSDDETPEESNNMVELIPCNDVEPEVEPEPDAMEVTEEFLVDLLKKELEHQQSLHVNVCIAKNDANPVIDVVTEETSGNANTEITDSVPQIDSIDEPTFNEEDLSIEEIVREINSKHPGSLQSITRDEQNGQLAIEICKNSSFQSEEEYTQLLDKVAKLIKGTIIRPASTQEEQVNNLEELQYTRHSPENLNNEGLPEPQSGLNNGHHGIRLDNGSSSNADISQTHTLQLNNTEAITNWNESQILNKSELYLGVTLQLFQRIENLLQGRFNDRSVLILLLRKIKLNESFSTLSDVLFPNTNECTDIYNNCLPELSRTLQGFLQWPKNCRQTIAIVDIFEMQIKKPDSVIEQNLSFCKERQQYLVKFLICCTPSRYITHVSMPFYSIHTNVIKTCLLSIPENCSTIVLNSNFLDYGSELVRFERVSPLNTNHAAKNCISLVFNSMRQFTLINETLNWKNFKLLRPAVSVIASLCNLKEK